MARLKCRAVTDSLEEHRGEHNVIIVVPVVWAQGLVLVREVPFVWVVAHVGTGGGLPETSTATATSAQPGVSRLRHGVPHLPWPRPAATGQSRRPRGAAAQTPLWGGLVLAGAAVTLFRGNAGPALTHEFIFDIVLPRSCSRRR